MTAAIDKLFDLRDQRDASGVMNNWESLNFYDVPVVAGLASLSKLQADIRSAENDVVKWMHNSIEANIAKVDQLMPAVIPQSNYVMVGDSFRAEVFLAAYDSRNRPRIDFNGPNALPMGSDGRARLRLPTTSLGEQTGTGVIHFNGPEGPMEFPYEVNYQVVAPTLVASPIKMNVLYRFVENPIDLSVPGVQAERVSAAISNGTIVRGPDGSWIAKPGAGNDARVEAIVTMPEGGTRRIGPALFRVKDLPAPMPYVAGKGPRDATIRLAELKAAERLIAKLEGSEFNEPFTIVEFECTLMRGSQPVSSSVAGGPFSPQLKQVLDQARAGNKVHFEFVKARLASGQGPVYSLAPITLRIVP